MDVSTRGHTGQEQIALLLEKQHMGYFDDIERKFISSLKGKKYASLSKHEKAVIARLIAWMIGH